MPMKYFESHQYGEVLSGITKVNTVRSLFCQIGRAHV